jgi:hypothetical protein
MSDESLLAPINSNKLKCDHCGKIIDSGLMNCIDHNMNDCIKGERKIGDNYIAAYTPYLSFTAVPEDKKPDQ